MFFNSHIKRQDHISTGLLIIALLVGIKPSKGSKPKFAAFLR